MRICFVLCQFTFSDAKVAGINSIRACFIVALFLLSHKSFGWLLLLLIYVSFRPEGSIHSLTHSTTHPPIHSLTNSLTHSHTHSLSLVRKFPRDQFPFDSPLPAPD